tara:strand:+ start:19805 stop:20149 length:345 start_codon:yes stop_codon:yes gene_type:complete
MTYINISRSNIIINNLQKFYPSFDFKNLLFREAFIIASWNINCFPKHSFKVLAHFPDHDFKENGRKLCCFLKPISSYEVSEFETLFNFSQHCSDFDQNKIIALEYIDDNGIIIT